VSVDRVRVDPAPIVVLGVGNLLLGDDGAGLRVLRDLAALHARHPHALPPAVRLVEAETAGVELGDVIAGARALLVLDAVDVGATPGEVVVLRDAALAAAGARRPGGRAGGAAELIGLARLAGWLTGPAGLVGIQAGEIEVRIGLTEAVQAAVPAAVEASLDLLHALDVEAALAAGDDAPGASAVAPSGGRTPVVHRPASAWEAVR
jgi:hydrogenase maturation protease